MFDRFPVWYQIVEGQPVVLMFVIADQARPKPTSQEILLMLQSDDIVNSKPASLSAWRSQMSLDLMGR